MIYILLNNNKNNDINNIFENNVEVIRSNTAFVAATVLPGSFDMHKAIFKTILI